MAEVGGGKDAAGPNPAGCCVFARGWGPQVKGGRCWGAPPEPVGAGACWASGALSRVSAPVLMLVLLLLDHIMRTSDSRVAAWGLLVASGGKLEYAPLLPGTCPCCFCANGGAVFMGGSACHMRGGAPAGGPSLEEEAPHSAASLDAAAPSVVRAYVPVVVGASWWW